MDGDFTSAGDCSAACQGVAEREPPCRSAALYLLNLDSSRQHCTVVKRSLDRMRAEWRRMICAASIVGALVGR